MDPLQRNFRHYRMVIATILSMYCLTLLVVVWISVNVFHLETEQAVEHTQLMVSHLRKEDEVGCMLQTSIDQL
jgi:hypothetical protein